MKNSFTSEILEKMFLKKLLTDQDYARIFTGAFDKRWFDNKNISLLSGFVLKFFKKYDKLPSIPVVKAILDKYNETKQNSDFNYSKCVETLNEVSTFDLDISNDVYKDEIKTFVTNKGLLYAISDNIEDIEKFGNVDKCLKRFEKVQNIEFDTDVGMNYLKDIDRHFSEYIMNPAARISTGWVGVDKVTEGGFLRDGKSLYVFMGQAGLGKSVFLSNLAVNFLKNNMKVVVISLEMSQDVYAQRFDAHISKNNINKLNESASDSIHRIKEFFNEHPQSNLIIKDYPPNTITTGTIDNYLEKLKNSGVDFDILIVDYLNIIKADSASGSDNMYIGGKEISESLRALSYKYNVPVITAVQANTEGMNNEDIGMENIAQSRGIAHTGDFISALYQAENDQDNGVIRCRILKNRLGGKVGKSLMFKLNPENLSLSDITITSAELTAETEEQSNKSFEDIALGELE